MAETATITMSRLQRDVLAAISEQLQLESRVIYAQAIHVVVEQWDDAATKGEDDG